MLSPRDLDSRPDNMDETVPHTLTCEIDTHDPRQLESDRNTAKLLWSVGL